MSLSRKRRRELKRLRSQAEELLDQQRVVLGQAGTVLQEAKKQARHLNNEVVMPRVNSAIDTVRPQVDRGILAARRAANQVRRTTAPFVTAALANTIRSLEELESPEAANQVRRFGERTGYLAPAKKKSRLGTILSVGLGLAAAAGVGYALWQAFRSEDELWVAPEQTDK